MSASQIPQTSTWNPVEICVDIFLCAVLTAPHNPLSYRCRFWGEQTHYKSQGFAVFDAVSLFL